MISIHALREEGDLQPGTDQKGADISIHALREEGDLIAAYIIMNEIRFLSTPSARRATISGSICWAAMTTFLSTPSARRATYFFFVPSRLLWISIHALREEGDTSFLPIFV